ncbi:MAG: plasmid pRiA4b ORF-3 family protein [Acidimicrobiales bacterium]
MASIDSAGTLTLEKLHYVIQAAMGWGDCHEHAFEIYDKRYSLSNFEFEEDLRDLEEDGVRIHPLLGDGDHFTYEYDFGDTWIHVIEVESVSDATSPLNQALCVDGARACPPEDCGGPRRFADFLSATADPSNEEHDSMIEWYGGTFDPAAFNLGDANARIQRVH